MAERLRVLVIDPDPSLPALVPAMAERHGVDVRPCTEPGQAYMALTGTRVDAVVVGSEVPDAAAVVAHARRERADVMVFVLSARVDERALAAAEALCADGLLAKPLEASRLAQALSRHRRAGAGVAAATTGGTVTGLPTAQAIALHCEASRDVVLALRDGSKRGQIHVEVGQLVHAETGALVGEAAVREMLSWAGAELRVWTSHGGCPRTIVGRWEGLLEGRGAPLTLAGELEEHVAIVLPDVIERLSRLAQTPDVLGAFLLRHGEVMASRCTGGLDEALASQALARLSQVWFDVDRQPYEEAGTEVQAVLGTLRLVIDRIGPAEVGFQVGVVVRQAAPICKSLRRLLRQIDRACVKAMRQVSATDARAVAAGHSPVAAVSAPRVA